MKQQIVTQLFPQVSLTDTVNFSSLFSCFWITSLTIVPQFVVFVVAVILP